MIANRAYKLYHVRNSVWKRSKLTPLVDLVADRIRRALVAGEPMMFDIMDEFGHEFTDKGLRSCAVNLIKQLIQHEPAFCEEFEIKDPLSNETKNS